MQIFNSWRF